MSEFEDKIIADIRARAVGAFASLGEEIADDLRETISIPVERIGSSLIRSLPGEPPRKETGGYRLTIEDDTQDEGDRVRTSIFTDSVIGKYLEYGTSRMAARPHFAEIYEKYAAIAARMIAQRMKLN
jgi:hypothetical protein